MLVMGAVGLAMALAGPGVAVAPHDGPTSAEPTDPVKAITALELAQSRAAEGEIQQALQSLEDAIRWDPTLASAYLMRAQLLFELLGNPPQPPDDDEARRVWIDLGEQAVSDLSHYIELSSLDPGMRRLFEARRDELKAALDQAREDARHDEAPGDTDSVVVEPDPDPEPAQTRARRGLPLGLMIGGAGLSAGGVTASAAALRIRPQCLDTQCSVARWEPSRRWMPTGVVLSIAGAGLVTTGAVLLARRGPATAAARRRRRGAGVGLLASAGVALVTGAVLAGISARRAAREVDDLDGLSSTQSMSNAALAAGALVPSLLGGGLGLWLPSR